MQHRVSSGLTEKIPESPEVMAKLEISKISNGFLGTAPPFIFLGRDWLWYMWAWNLMGDLQKWKWLYLTIYFQNFQEILGSQRLLWNVISTAHAATDRSKVNHKKTDWCEVYGVQNLEEACLVEEAMSRKKCLENEEMMLVSWSEIPTTRHFGQWVAHSNFIDH